MTPIEFENWLLTPRRRTLVMGVLNVTPDSFSDGGRYNTAESAVAHARQMIADGVDLIDIGGESTRPGAQRVPADEQIARVVPVIKQVAALGVTLSIDTTHPAVAAAALDAGAAVINDITAGTEAPDLLKLAAQRKCPMVLMHSKGDSQSMQSLAVYNDVVAEVRQYLLARIAAAESAGVARHRILIDPGIGFAKTADHNLLLLHHLRSLADDGYGVLVGTSRKAFIGKLIGEPQPQARDIGTAATVAWAVANGAAVVRVHDVTSARQTVIITEAIQRGCVS
jgi:dihydropteroate synthase